MATNTEISDRECMSWLLNPPDTYLVYLKRTTHSTGMVTTWMGKKLGVAYCGESYRDNFGGIRVPITVYGTIWIRLPRYLLRFGR